MATYRDWEMLQNAIGNVGNAVASRRHENDVNAREMDRLALEHQMQDRQDARADEQDEPTVTTYLVDPTNPQSGMLFRGHPKQLEALKSSAEKAGKQLQESAEPPSKDFAATFKVGGSTYSFKDPASAENMRKAFADRGINVEDDKYASGAGHGKSLAITQALEKADEYRAQAQAADDPDDAARLNELADITTAWAKKQTQFAPPKQPFNSDTQINYDSQGRKTGERKTYSAPKPSNGLPSAFGHQVTLQELQVPLAPANNPIQQPAPNLSHVPETVPPPQQRQVGKVYKLPKGQFQWTGQGWLPAQ